MATTVTTTKTLALPDMTDRFGAPGNPIDGYIVTYSASDGYYLAKPPSRLLIISSPSTSPYNVGTEDVVLVQNHVGAFIVNLPTSPLIGTNYYIKDFAGVAAANNINIATTQLIDGLNPYVINTNFGSIRVVFNGTTWSAIQR